MSIRLMTLVWDIEFPTQSQKLIMLKLADYASDTGGSVFPATETLADKVGCDERTVQRAIKAFRDVGLLHLVRAGGTKPGATNEWQINITMIGWLAGETIKLVGHGGELEIEGTIPGDTPGNLSPAMGDITPGNLSPWVTNSTKGVTPVSPTPGTTATQSVNNHQIDSSRANERASDGARAPSAARPVPQFVLTPSDSSWSHWLTWLSDKDRRDLVLAAEEAQRMTVLGSNPSRRSKDFW
jgi:hypothetical protein